MTIDNEKYTSFKDFYPYYLSEHSNPQCRLLHFIGSCLVLLVILYVTVTAAFIWLWALPIIGYGFAWIGHFFYEHNKPATFKYPFYSLLGDWVMFKDILVGKVKIK